MCGAFPVRRPLLWALSVVVALRGLVLALVVHLQNLAMTEAQRLLPRSESSLVQT